MTDRFRLNPGSVETRQFLAWVDEQVATEQRQLESVECTHEKACMLRGRLSAWRMIQALAAPPRELTIDGEAV